MERLCENCANSDWNVQPPKYWCKEIQRMLPSTNCLNVAAICKHYLNKPPTLSPLERAWAKHMPKAKFTIPPDKLTSNEHCVLVAEYGATFTAGWEAAWEWRINDQHDSPDPLAPDASK